MAITPTYSWPLPDDTDLVKDGAEAIRDLGNAIDTTVGGLSGAGLVYINTTTFSGVSTQSINNVFSAEYDNYKILIDVSKSTTSFLQLRWRAAGADNTTTNYRYTEDSAFATSTAQNISNISNSNGSHRVYTVDVINPFKTETTQYFGMGVQKAGGQEKRPTGDFNATDSFDGLTLIASSGTISGLVTIWGYKS
jgi:hypothetical protein